MTGDSYVKKPYLVFCYTSYYPSGGSGDFVGAFSTFEEAEEAANSNTLEFADIYDAVNEKWIDVDKF